MDQSLQSVEQLMIRRILSLERHILHLPILRQRLHQAEFLM